MKRLVRELRRLPRVGKVGLCLLLIAGIAAGVLLAVNDIGGKSPRNGRLETGRTTTTIESPPPADSVPGTSAPTSAPPDLSTTTLPATGAGPGGPAVASAPSSSLPPASPPTAGPNHVVVYSARCFDGTKASGPDISKLCHGHRGVRYFIPQ
jgi:hypothetical protein